MNNVKMSVEKDVLTIKINLKERLGESKSGKSMVIATTGGNVKLDPPHDKVSIGINCYEKI